MAFVWSLALVAAVSWPGRLAGAFDGAPFDTLAKALAFGVVLPALWWLYPAFLKTPAARTLVVLLLAWKVSTWMLVPQAGWCGQFLVRNPPQAGGWSLTRSWDARTYWDSTPPACSAIVARGYLRPTHFPVWSINVPYGHDRDLSSGGFVSLAEENPRPPDGQYAFQVRGAVYAAATGTLRLLIGSDVAMSGDVDAHPIAAVNGQETVLELGAGPHEVNLLLNLTGRNWRFVPLWNGADLFSATATGIEPLTRVGAVTQRIARWVTPILVLGLLGWWSWAALSMLKPGGVMLTATALLAAAIAAIASLGGESTAARAAVLLLAGCLFIPVPQRIRDARGAWLLVGAPWLTLISALAMRSVGRFTLFLFGDDALTYQRFAHRIFMEGFWLEGGQPTFWNQPLYRWICGVLHLFFGDSSAGETVWDGFALLAGSMFAFAVVNRAGGFRFGIGAAVAVLLTFALGPNWYLIGRGLSEISALMWIYLAGSCLINGTATPVRMGLLAGAFAALAFYTRMNHLPLVLALGVLALDATVAAGSLFDLRLLWRRLSGRAASAYYAALAAGLCAFAARTWYFTGVFGLFTGTSLGFNAIGLGTSLRSWWSIDVWRRTISSVLMLVTVQDPPRFDWRSSLVVAGVGVSALALLRVPLARRLPLGIVVACLAAVAGGLVVRGTAYPGRFSVHLIPVAVTVSMLMAVHGREVAR